MELSFSGKKTLQQAVELPQHEINRKQDERTLKP
jgi:hypothetical protein